MSQVVIENPIINSPFEEPTRHFRFTDEGITDEIVDGREYVPGRFRFLLKQIIETLGGGTAVSKLLPFSWRERCRVPVSRARPLRHLTCCNL